MYVLCVDPGVRGCGVAVFKDKVLHRAVYVKNSKAAGLDYEAQANMAADVMAWLESERIRRDIGLAIIERMKVYPQAAQQKGDPNDLLAVAGVGGAIAGQFLPTRVKSSYAYEWKGQVPKKIMNERILEKLTAYEMGMAKLGNSKDHNVVDAIGIGLSFLGRLNRRVTA